ncbi:uncharacterized protein LOC107636302 [Arachis ipaensis]|uniref:uncharacterized protein LOC107636302 n=1 Tax=Arachis ipaensis TaxID=130454 RepID=UPI0007AF9A2E|nr:uncharacterized protein LOC107636302 [Arachis ipaensis]XP_025647476.1 uncharacterized protein LOC112742457 [Arachis hypogaea]
MGTILQDHSKLDSDTVAEAIRPLVESDPSIKVKSIITEVQSRFNYTISYRKAWLTKQKSIAKVFGGWEDSYQALAWWLSVMTQKMPGSIVQIETRPLYNGTEEADGTLLVAVAQDGNQNIVPIAFALVEGETADAWHFFLRNLRKHVVRSDGVGYSRIVEEYNINYKRLEERGEAYARWCDAIGLRHWVLTFDEGHRWGHMTTNLVECINSILKGARNLPVLALVRATYYRLNEIFTRKSAETHERKRAGFNYSVFAQHRIEANIQRAGNIVVHRFDRRNEVFEVREMPNGKVLVERLPYRHVIACCANQRLDWQLYVHDVYRMTEVCKVYRFEFVPLGDAETWPAYQGPTLVANLALRRTSKGRPKLT